LVNVTGPFALMLAASWRHLSMSHPIFFSF
jgi:hypothetical protein